jgi:signal peptidase I
VVAVALAGGKSPEISGVVTRITVSSPSMVPALRVGSTVRVLVAGSYTPRVGDIVVLHPPSGTGPAPSACGNPDQGAGHAAACDRPAFRESPRALILRIVAGPGDTITIKAGHVIRKGAPEPDSADTEPCGSSPGCTFRAPITIPRGYYFVLGDNRAASDDSRFWGPVPRAYILGRVLR